MGMEHIEIIMRVEEEFGIEVADREAEAVRTPRDLCALIERKVALLAAEQSSGCPSSRAFYRVRRELTALGIERADVKPGATVEALLPLANRRALWKQLDERLEVGLRPLHRSPFWTYVALSPLAALPFVWHFAGEAPMVAMCFCLPLVWWVGFRATQPLAVRVPTKHETVAHLSRRLASTLPVVGDESPTRELWPQLQGILSDELGVPLEKVTPDADFVRDLGVG